MLGRLAGDNPPAVVCVDPRPTPVARHATVHLAPLPGTNVALMNALLHEIIRNDWVDHDYVDDRTTPLESIYQGVGIYLDRQTQQQPGLGRRAADEGRPARNK